MTPEIEQLQRQINDLQSRLSNVETSPSYNVNPLMSINQRDTIVDFIQDEITDILWENIFYYSTFFDSLDGLSATAGVTVNEAGLTLTTTNVSSNYQSAYKAPNNTSTSHSVFSFAKQSRIRIRMRADSITSVTQYLGTGVVVGDVTGGGNSYGFKIVNGALQGFAGSFSSVTGTTTETVVALDTLVINTNYTLEARNYLSKIAFYVNGVQRGVISNGIPGGAEYLRVYQFTNLTTENVAKVLKVSSFEFIQDRT